MKILKKIKNKYRKSADDKKISDKKYNFWSIVTVVILLALFFIYEQTSREPKVSYLPPADIASGEEIETVDEVKINLEEQKQQERIKIEQNPDITSRDLEATFSDSFSGQGWIDESLTDLYFDWNSTKFFFPPAIELKEILNNDALNQFTIKDAVLGDEKILIFGKNKINGASEIKIWRPKENIWQGIKSNLIGFGQSDEIISAKFLKQGKWLVFAKDNNSNIKISFLNQDFLLNKNKDLGPNFDSKIICGEKICFLRDNNNFFEFDIAVEEIKKSEKIAEVFKDKSPEQIDTTFFNSEKSILIAASFGNNSTFWQYDLETGIISQIFSKTSEYPGYLTVFSRANGKIFVLRGGYLTEAYEVSEDRSVNDLSQKFGIRIFSNQPAQIYETEDILYIKNENGSIIRWDGFLNFQVNSLFGLNFTPDASTITRTVELDKTKKIINSYYFVSVPGAGTKIYQISDKGFDFSRPRQIVSKKFNSNGTIVRSAQIRAMDSDAAGAKIAYFLSSDDGQTWEVAEVGKTRIFEKPGENLRWSATIIPDENNPLKTPYFDNMFSTYWYSK